MLNIADFHRQIPSKPVFGEVSKPFFTAEAHKNIEFDKKSGIATVAEVNMPKLEIDMNIVTAASESYQISPRVEDYLVIPMPIVTVDIPNRNLQCFPVEEATYFDPQYGQMVYETFKGKCTFSNHDNEDPLQAKGIIADASLQWVPKYGVWKICIVSMWDRTKDEELIRQIMAGERNGYSMGSMVNAFVCSICGKEDPLNHNTCDHLRGGNKGAIWGQNSHLSYQYCLGSCFFEVSSVDDPADPTALTNDVFV